MPRSPLFVRVAIHASFMHPCCLLMLSRCHVLSQKVFHFKSLVKWSLSCEWLRRQMGHLAAQRCTPVLSHVDDCIPNPVLATGLPPMLSR